jgi:hypothetical protein
MLSTFGMSAANKKEELKAKITKIVKTTRMILHIVYLSLLIVAY